MGLFLLISLNGFIIIFLIQLYTLMGRYMIMLEFILVGIGILRVLAVLAVGIMFLDFYIVERKVSTQKVLVRMQRQLD